MDITLLGLKKKLIGKNAFVDDPPLDKENYFVALSSSNTLAFVKGHVIMMVFQKQVIKDVPTLRGGICS